MTWPFVIDEVSASTSVPRLSIVSPEVASWLVIAVPLCAVSLPAMSIALAVPLFDTVSPLSTLAVPETLTWLVLVSVPLFSDAVVRSNSPLLVTMPPVMLALLSVSFAAGSIVIWPELATSTRTLSVPPDISIFPEAKFVIVL